MNGRNPIGSQLVPSIEFPTSIRRILQREIGEGDSLDNPSLPAYDNISIVYRHITHNIYIYTLVYMIYIYAYNHTQSHTMEWHYITYMNIDLPVLLLLNHIEAMGWNLQPPGRCCCKRWHPIVACTFYGLNFHEMTTWYHLTLWFLCKPWCCS